MPAARRVPFPVSPLLLVAALALASYAGCARPADPAGPPEPARPTARVAVPDEDPALAAARPAPALVLDGPGGTFDLAAQRGRLVVLHLLGGAPSASNAAFLSALHDELAPDGVVLAAVAEADAAELSALPDSGAVHWLADPAGAARAALGPFDGDPATVILDGAGRIRAALVGPQTVAQVLALVGPIIIETDDGIAGRLSIPLDTTRLVPLPAAEVPVLLADGAMLIDVRPAARRVAEGAVPDAAVVERITAEALPADLGVPLIFLADSPAGAARADADARALGYVATFEIEGGLAAWKAAGLTVKPGRATVVG